MTSLRCLRESELLDALSGGRWPEACDGELRDHVTACDDCRDLLVVAEALIMDRRETEIDAELPPAGAVWWRMQLRLEREAKDAAARTVGRAHGAVVAATVAVITIVLITTSLVKMGWSWLASVAPPMQDVLSLSSTVPLTVVALVGIAILVFAPVAVYLALAEE